MLSNSHGSLGSLASPVHACAGLRSAGLARVHRRICSSSSSSSQPPAPPGSSEPRRTGFPQRTVCSRQPLRSAHTRGDPTQVSTPTPPPPSSPWASVQRQPLPTASLPLGAHRTEPKGKLVFKVPSRPFRAFPTLRLAQTAPPPGSPSLPNPGQMPPFQLTQPLWVSPTAALTSRSLPHQPGSEPPCTGLGGEVSPLKQFQGPLTHRTP